MTAIDGYIELLQLCNSHTYDPFLADMQRRWLEALYELLSDDNYISKCMSSDTEERYNHNHDPHTGRFTSGDGVNTVDNSGESGTISTENKTEMVGDTLHKVCKIKTEMYQSTASGKILTDEVIITDNRIEHIKERRGEAFFDEYYMHFSEVLTNPDFIFADDKPNTAIASKEYKLKDKTINIVLKLAVEGDNPDFKNSIITAIGESEKRFAQRLRNRTPLYKKLDKQV